MNSKRSLPDNSDLPKKVALFRVQDLPEIKFVNIPQEKYDSHPVRAAIMKILREGLSENNNINRYALNVKEIKILLREREKIEISVTNLYFHINKMLNAEFITIIDIVKKKRHKIAYYGRTAQMNVFYDSEHEIQKYKKMFFEFEKFSKFLKPKDDITTLKDLPEQLYKLKQEHEEKLASWLFQYKDVIIHENLNFNEIFNVLKLIDTSDSEYLLIIKRLQDMLPNTINFSK